MSLCSSSLIASGTFIHPYTTYRRCQASHRLHGAATTACSPSRRHTAGARPPSRSAASSHIGTADHEAQQQQQQQKQPITILEVRDPQAVLRDRLSECPACGGTGRVVCKDCSGKGYLPRGGYSKKNPMNLSRAVGSKWTAMVPTLGWRHFRVIAVRKLDNQKANIYLLLQASCDSSAQLWVNVLALRNRSCWAAGWLQMSELVAEAEGVTAGSSKGQKCHTCASLGYRACTACNGRGRTDLVRVT